MKGLNDVLNNLKQIEKASMEAIAKGLEEGLIKLGEESLKEAPLDESPLRQSMQIRVNGTTIGTGTASASINKSGNIKPNTKLEANIGYGTDKETAKYAVIQHEELSFKHPTAGTKAKYLEDPFKRNQIEKTIQEELRKVIK